MANSEKVQIPEWMKTTEGVLERITELRDQAVSEARGASFGAIIGSMGIVNLVMAASPDTSTGWTKGIMWGAGLVASILGSSVLIQDGISAINSANEANNLEAALVLRINGLK